MADDAIRYGDNDRIAALVANLLRADLLVLLTDTPGVLTADPRIEPSATLIEEIAAIDQAIEEVAGTAGSRGSGGMASKLAAARMASWSGVRTVIAAADRPEVLAEAIAGISVLAQPYQPASSCRSTQTVDWIRSNTSWSNHRRRRGS